MAANAKDVPTLGEVAENVGVSVRALTGAFRRFCDMTPMGFLRKKRLQGVRKELLDSKGKSTVSAIVSRWGYANFGVFAKSYKDRFGELPSETLHQSRKQRQLFLPSKDIAFHLKAVNRTIAIVNYRITLSFQPAVRVK